MLSKCDHNDDTTVMKTMAVVVCIVDDNEDDDVADADYFCFIATEAPL